MKSTAPEIMVGKRGVEPLLQEPESCVLPLDDFPKKNIMSITAFEIVSNIALNSKIASINLSRRL